MAKEKSAASICRERPQERATPDGRRLRSSRSRAEIIRAMVEIIRSGDMSPSAARIAEFAGVSLRTVFRHFDDVDSLYREMSSLVEEEVRPLAARPIKGQGWRERLFCLIDRRTEIFERIAPFRIAGSLRRFSSEYLMADHQRFVRLERATLLDVLPRHVCANATLVNALELTTGFQAWRRLRQDQELSMEEARAAILFTVEQLIAGLDA